jgi:hypothetical protein
MPGRSYETGYMHRRGNSVSGAYIVGSARWYCLDLLPGYLVDEFFEILIEDLGDRSLVACVVGKWRKSRCRLMQIFFTNHPVSFAYRSHDSFLTLLPVD